MTKFKNSFWKLRVPKLRMSGTNGTKLKEIHSNYHGLELIL